MSKNHQFKRRIKWIGVTLFFLVIIYGSLIGFSKNSIRIWFFTEKEALAQSQPEFHIEIETNPNFSQNCSGGLLILQENSLFPLNSIFPKEERITRRFPVIITAYSSSRWETDDTPFITASGSFVREGIAANNLLPFGTKFKIPEIFGEEVFIVEDRLSSKKGNYHVDIWFPSREEALKFGTKRTYIEILSEES